MQGTSASPAGCWARGAVGLLDMAGAAIVVVCLAKTLAWWGWYVPIELGVLVLYAAYTATAIAWRGQTPGQWLGGQKVLRRDGRRVGPMRAAVRALAVVLSLGLLGLPLLGIAWRRSKRGWHDRLMGTQVCVVPARRRRGRWTVILVWLAAAGWVAAQTGQGWRLHAEHRAWLADADAVLEKQEAPGEPPISVSSLDETQRQAMRAWLVDAGQNPADCLAQIAGRHQVTMVGEAHGKKEFLAFLNQMVPRLYREAGIRVIALECCPCDQNGRLARLVAQPQFDRALALKIARANPWESWGWRGYWDLLQTVWEFNRSLRAEEEPLQVVGICPRFDIISFALVRGGPWTEKFRIVRVLPDAPTAFWADAVYANQVERQAFRKGKRTLVLVGESHASLRGVRPKLHRMGSMLYGRYPHQIAHVTLHAPYDSYGQVGELIEDCVPSSPGYPVAFVVENSPFARLRDDSAYFFGQQPGRRFADMVTAYVVLAPARALGPCDWMKDYISPCMFGRNRPAYEMMVGHPLADAREANRCMSEGMQF